MKVITIVAVFVAFVAVTNAGGPGKVIMCYYKASPDWPLAVNQLKDADKCTHVIFSFFRALPDGNLEVNDMSLQEFSTLKELNPNMKLMVTVNVNQVFEPNNDSYSVVLQYLVQNVKNLLEKYNLDGVDMRLSAYDFADSNISQLIRDLKATLLKSNKILTFTTTHEESIRISKSCNITEMSNYLDYFIIIPYIQTDVNYAFNQVKDRIEFLLQKGVEPGKLVWGTDVFGWSNKFGMVSKGYKEICRKIKSEGYKRTFSDEKNFPIITKYNETINYEDKQTLKLKADLVNQLNLGGVAMRLINGDDAENECGDGKFPLLNALSEGLNGIISVN